MNFIDKIKTKRINRAYRNGFSWAFRAYYLDGEGMQHINHTIDHRIEHPFDKGAAYAVKIIQRRAFTH